MVNGKVHHGGQTRIVDILNTLRTQYFEIGNISFAPNNFNIQMNKIVL